MSAPTNPEDSVQAMRRMAPADLLNTSDPRQANVAPGTSTLATALVTVDRLSARVAKLEAALRFYAEPSGYLLGLRFRPVVVDDGGMRARAALEDKS